MPDYRRWYQPGGTYFFTVVTHQRRRIFGDATARRLLGEVMREVAHERPFRTLAIVLLGDHLHCAWSLPRGDSDFSARWRSIKGRFTTAWIAAGGEAGPVSASRASRGHRGVWQKRFFEHLVRDEDDLEHCCDYIHYNPVRHGYVARPRDWPWSSFRRFVREAHYPEDWGRSEPSTTMRPEWE